ncbi:MAG: diguanylate cyclase, partial [Spirochaetales bacterium]|nr:diguanylate cyclase [Spirochaetales bacterium]
MKIKSSFDSINLETLNESATDLAKNYIYRLDNYVMIVASIIVVLVNLFWLGMELLELTTPFTLIGNIGVFIGILFPLIVIFYLFRRDESDNSMMRFIVIFFQMSIILSTACLNLNSHNAYAATGGISLVMFWFIICALVPMVSIVDSIVMMGILFLSSFLPQLLFQGPQYVNTNNILVGVCIVIAYFYFRKFAIMNSGLIQKLAFTSYIDHQTGTMNKRALHEYLENLSNQDIQNFGVIIYDIDDLRSYNYKYTHLEGDKMLLKVNNSVL